MSLQALKYSFRYTNNKPDPNFRFLRDCLSRHAYVLYKNQYEDCLNYWISCMNDMTFSIATTEKDEIMDLGFPDNIRWNTYVKYNPVDTTHDSPINTLLKLLDDGHTPTATTIYHLLKFSVYYNPSIDVATYQPAHNIIILHYDEENYYFFDSLSIDFEPYKENKEIGVIKRKEADPVFEKQLKLDLITFDDMQEDYLRKNIQCLLDMYITRFADKSKQFVKSYLVQHGEAAFEKLINICENKKPSFQTPAKLFTGEPLSKILAWKATMIIGRKSIVSWWLEQCVGDAGKDTNNVLKKTIDIWEIIKSKVVRDSQNISRRLNAKYAELFRDAYFYEKELHAKMKNFLTYNRVCYVPRHPYWSDVPR